MSLFQFVETREFQIENSLFRVATNVDTTYTDTQDVGLFGQYYDGANICYTGLFRDSADAGKYKLFHGLQTLPVVTDGTAKVNTSGTGFTLSDLSINNFHATGNAIIDGNLTVNGVTTTVNSSTLTVEDNIIVANAGPTGQLQDAGFVVRRVPSYIVAGDTPKQSGTASASGTTTTVTLQAANGHGTTLNYYQGWIIKFGGDITGTAIVTSSTAADPPTLTFDTAASGTTTTSTTYQLFNKQYTGWIYDEATDYYTLYGFPREDLQADISTIGSGGNGNLADFISLKTLDISSAGNISATGSVSAGTSMSAGTTITATGNISSTTGNISTTVGNITSGGNMSATTSISAGTTISAVNNITSSTGNIVSTIGNVTAGAAVSAGTTITAVGDITSTTGNILATLGQVNAGTSISSGTSITAGNSLTVTTGDLTVTTGNFNLPLGNATIGGNLSVAGVINAPINIDDNILPVNVGPTITAPDFGFVGKRTATNIGTDLPKISSIVINTNYTSGSTTIIFNNAATGTNYYKGWILGNSVNSQYRTIVSSSESGGVHTAVLDSGFTTNLIAGTDTLKLYNRTYIGPIWHESTKTIMMVGFPRETGETIIDPISPVNGNIPDYANLSVQDLQVNGTFSFSGTITHHTLTQVAAVTFSTANIVNNDIIFLNPSALTTYTLPTIASLTIPANTSYIIVFININATNEADLTTSGGNLIEGVSTIKLKRQWAKTVLIASSEVANSWMVKG